MAHVVIFINIPSLEHFQAKWTPVRVKKMRQNKDLEHFCDSMKRRNALKSDANMPTKQRFQIDCSPDNAFHGFTDQTRIIDWWGDPSVYETISWMADFRDGGQWRAEFKAPGGTRFGAGGTYVSIEQSTRLEWTWRADWAPEVEKIIEMRFIPSGLGTELIIETRGHHSAESESIDQDAWVVVVDWFNRALGKQN